MEEATPSAANRSFWSFVARTAALLFMLAVFLNFVLPDFSDIKASLYGDLYSVKTKLDGALKREQSKLYLLSFIQNPAVLYKTSELAEQDGKLENAIRDMELAIGLLELHNADRQVIKRYYGRLEKLQAAPKPAK